MTNARVWLLGCAVLAGGLWVLGVGALTAADDNLGKEVLKLADDMAKKDANVQKNADALGKKNDAEALMDLFKPRGKGTGLGVGDKPGIVPAKEDGIEKKIQAMDKKAMTPATIQAEADAIAKAAYVTATVAEAISGNVPPKEKKKAAQWKKLADDMKKSSLDLAEAIKAAKPDPGNIQKITQKLNNACIACHDEFR